MRVILRFWGILFDKKDQWKISRSHSRLFIRYYEANIIKCCKPMWTNWWDYWAFSVWRNENNVNKNDDSGGFQYQVYFVEFYVGTLIEIDNQRKDCRTVSTQTYITMCDNWTRIDYTNPADRLIQSSGYQRALGERIFL